MFANNRMGWKTGVLSVCLWRGVGLVVVGVSGRWWEMVLRLLKKGWLRLGLWGWLEMDWRMVG